MKSSHHERGSKKDTQTKVALHWVGETASKLKEEEAEVTSTRSKKKKKKKRKMMMMKKKLVAGKRKALAKWFNVNSDHFNSTLNELH